MRLGLDREGAFTCKGTQLRVRYRSEIFLVPGLVVGLRTDRVEATFFAEGR